MTEQQIVFFDSHAHYDDSRFDNEFSGGSNGAISSAYKEGVKYIVNAGTNPETSLNSVKLAEKYSFIYATAGIHPSDCQSINFNDCEKSLVQIRSLLSHPKVAAIGEIGLDYHYENTDREKQKYFFESQLCIAEESNLPVVVHDRDAHGDVFDILSRHSKVKGVVHCFSGSSEMARQLTNNGWYLSFGGSLTFKNALKVKEAASIVPEDLLLIETDAPYMAPTPYRGKINYSGYIKYTVKALSEIRGVSMEQIASSTFHNALNFFNIHT